MADTGDEIDLTGNQSLALGVLVGGFCLTVDGEGGAGAAAGGTTQIDQILEQIIIVIVGGIEPELHVVGALQLLAFHGQIALGSGMGSAVKGHGGDDVILVGLGNHILEVLFEHVVIQTGLLLLAGLDSQVGLFDQGDAQIAGLVADSLVLIIFTPGVEVDDVGAALHAGAGNIHDIIQLSVSIVVVEVALGAGLDFIALFVLFVEIIVQIAAGLGVGAAELDIVQAVVVLVHV